MTKIMGVVFGLLLLVTPGLRATITLDLITGNTASETAAIGGDFRVDWTNIQTSGTGVIDSFLRIQAPGSTKNERGYNTDDTAPLDAKGGTFTHSLTLGDITTVNLSGVLYRVFLLDINQNTSGSNRYLSVNQIQIFTMDADPGSDVGAYTLSADGVDELIVFPNPDASEVFRMNTPATGNRLEIQLDYNRNPGSGAGDMFLYVPASVFAGVAADKNIVLFSQLGTPTGEFETNDGVEEWAVLKSTAPPSVPEPASILLFGTVLIGASYLSRRRRKA